MGDAFNSPIWTSKTYTAVGLLLLLTVQICISSNCDSQCVGCDQGICTDCKDDYFVYKGNCSILCENSNMTTRSPPTTTVGTTAYNDAVPCMEDCPSQYFKDGNTCIMCDPECVNCTGPSSSNCTSCQNYYDTGLQACVSSCQNDTYEEMEAKLCQPCHVNCTEGCTGPGFENCTTTVVPTIPTTDEPSDDSMLLYIIIGATVGGVILIAIIIAIIVCCCRHGNDGGGEDVESKVVQPSFNDITNQDSDSDGQSNQGCEPDEPTDIYGNVDKWGNLINIPAHQTTPEALENARQSRENNNSGAKYQNSAGAAPVLTEDEYVNPDFPQAALSYGGPTEEYVAPGDQAQWGQEYTALDQSTIQTGPQYPTDDHQSQAHSPEAAPVTCDIYQNIEQVQAPPPISPRHASLMGTAGSPKKKPTAAALHSLEEDVTPSVPAPVPPKRDQIEMAEIGQKKHQKWTPSTKFDSDLELPPPPPDEYFGEQLDSLPFDDPPPPPIDDFRQHLDSFPLNDPPPLPDDIGEHCDSIPLDEPPPPPVAKPADLIKPAPKKIPGKLNIPTTFELEKPPIKQKKLEKPAAKKGNVKGHAAKLEGIIPMGPPKAPQAKKQTPQAGYVDMKYRQPVKGKQKPKGGGMAIPPRPFTPAEISAARNKLISKGIYDENDIINIEEIYEAMENGHLDEMYESMEDLEPSQSVSQRPLPQQPSDTVYAVDDPNVYAVDDPSVYAVDDPSVYAVDNPRTGAARGQQKQMAPTKAIVPRKDQMNARKGKAKAKLPEPVQDEEYEFPDPDARSPAVPPREQPSNAQRPPELEEYAVAPQEPVPNVLPRKPLPPKKMEHPKHPPQTDETYEAVNVGNQQDDIYEPVEVAEDKPPPFTPYFNLPNVGPKAKDSDMVYRNLPGSRAQQHHPEGGYVRMQYKK